MKYLKSIFVSGCSIILFNSCSETPIHKEALVVSSNESVDSLLHGHYSVKYLTIGNQSSASVNRILNSIDGDSIEGLVIFADSLNFDKQLEFPNLIHLALYSKTVVLEEEKFCADEIVVLELHTDNFEHLNFVKSKSVINCIVSSNERPPLTWLNQFKRIENLTVDSMHYLFFVDTLQDINMRYFNQVE